MYAFTLPHGSKLGFTMPTTTTTPLCPKCGVNKKSGLGNCCARGGSWFQKCGDEGDTNFEHTWGDGFDACRDTDIDSGKLMQASIVESNNSSLIDHHDPMRSVSETGEERSTARRCGKVTTLTAVAMASISIFAAHV